MSLPIPQPPAIPFVGNALQIDSEYPARGFAALAKTYGEIYKMNILGAEVILISTYELVNEVSDDKRFQKKPSINPTLSQVKNLVDKGLFTAELDDPEWGVAHRLLMPAFGPTAIRGMFDSMLDIASQLVLKWERFGPEYLITPSADFTRLAFDTIAYCSMSYRLNSFYTDGEPRFVKAMGDFLLECGYRSRRPAVVQAMMRGASAKYDDDMKVMMDLGSQIVAQRRAAPTDQKDLLAIMLSGRDSQTGRTMSEENIAQNLLTFLIAGHETTSGLLSFALYNLLKQPDAMAKLRGEVDEVVGNGPPQLHHMDKLPYLVAVLRETLRVTPSIPVRSTTAKEDTTIGGGKYAVKKGSTILLIYDCAAKDPAVWGDDAHLFKPERMLDGKFEALPPNAWQPFGFGFRACIGRAFAWQEAILALALVVQRFDLVMEDPSYTLRIKSTLTVKPDGFQIRARPRPGKANFPFSPSSGITSTTNGAADKVRDLGNEQLSKLQHLHVFYGSNAGSAESFAQRIASDAPVHGFRPFVDTLDAAARRLPTDGPVVIVTASYEGEPPDNAVHFVRWISDLKEKELDGVKFGVFGCGNRDWVKTYQRIPTLCDERLAEGGAKRLLPRGEGDASGANFFEAFDRFEAALWEQLEKEYDTTQGATSVGLYVKTQDLGQARAIALRQAGMEPGKVVENKVLSALGAPTKRHIAFELPKDMSYESGDYLAILPSNPARDVHRVLAHFNLSSETEVTIAATGSTSLPIEKPVALSTVLNGYVELSQPATTRDLRRLIDMPSSQSTTDALKGLLANHHGEVQAKRLSVLDLLEIYSDVHITLGAFLDLLPPMRVRQYSISSSPLDDPEHVSLTVSVVDAPALSGRKTAFLGVASNFLHNLLPNDKVQMVVRPSKFHLPTDPAAPLVMICAGSGIAPFRGFIQERAAQHAAGRQTGKALLFFGCRAPGEDFLYGETELKKWSEQGVVDIRPAFSRSIDHSDGCKYVQDRLWHDLEDVAAAFHEGAKFYVCGSRSVATGVKEKLVEIIKVRTGITDDGEAKEWFDKNMESRFATDVFE